MKSVRAPQLLIDLYRDLRDRRLLVPAVALAVALIAVPMALSSAAPTSTAPDAAPATSEPDAASAAEPAVLTRELGVTAYRKRLNGVNSKNPFHQQFTLPEVTSKVEQSSLTEPVDATTSVATSADGTTSPSAPARTTSDSSTLPGANSGTPSPSEPSSEHSAGSSKPTLVVFQADLAIGPPGDLSRRKSVELGKFLPSEAKAMVAFAGATEDLKYGFFLVTDDVSSVAGDAQCVTGAANCRLMKLKVGKAAKLAFAPESDRTYKLRLFAIDLTPIDARTAKRGKRGSLPAAAAQG